MSGGMDRGGGRSRVLADQGAPVGLDPRTQGQDLCWRQTLN